MPFKIHHDTNSCVQNGKARAQLTCSTFSPFLLQISLSTQLSGCLTDALLHADFHGTRAVTMVVSETAKSYMQPYPLTPYLQASIALAAVLIAASAMFAALSVARDDKNARLVEIGVGILRADPTKEASAAAARQWALDLIDANAGGVKFSAEARTELTGQALIFKSTGPAGGLWYDYGSFAPSKNELAPSKPD